MRRIGRVALLAAVLIGGVAVVEPASGEEGEPPEGGEPVGAWGHVPEPVLQRAQSVQLSDGRVAVVSPGGSVFPNQPEPLPPPQVQVFDPATSSWSSPVATAIAPGNGHLRLVSLDDGDILLNGSTIIDPDDGSHRALDTPPSTTPNTTLTLLEDGRVLAAGFTSHLLDPKTGTWSPAAAMPEPREAHGATRLLDGRVLIAGGNKGQGAMGTSAIYDPASDTWTTTGSMTTPRYNPTLITLEDGRVIAAGGGVDCRVWDVFDPTTATWSATAPADRCTSPWGTAVLPDGRVLAAGTATPIDPPQVYDPAGDSWALTATPRLSRWAPRAFPFGDGRVLVLGAPSAPSESLGRYRPGSTAELFYSGAGAPPARPADVSVVDGVITWGPAPSPDVTSYRVYRAHGLHPLRLVATTLPTERSVTDEPPTSSTGYHYAVTAVGPAGESMLALGPGPFLPYQTWKPGSVWFIHADGRTELQWTALVDGDDRPTTFSVFRGRAPQSLVASVDAPHTGAEGNATGALTIDTPAPSTDELYEVRVTTESGDVEVVGTAFVTPPAPPPPPPPPVPVVSATGTSDDIGLEWVLPTGSPQPAGFSIDRWENGVVTNLARLPGHAAGLRDTEATPLRSYAYSVRAWWEDGSQSVSQWVTASRSLRMTVNAVDGDGAVSPVPLPGGGTYKVTAAGTYRWSAAGLADAECVKFMWTQDWRPRRLDVPKGRDLLDLRLNGRQIDWAGTGGPGTCDWDDHSYTTTLTPKETGPLLAQIDDDVYEDNTGSLTLTIERIS